MKLVEERKFFDSAGIPLYGAMHYPATDCNGETKKSGRRTVVVFCNAFSESHAEWRAEVIGARTLAERGYPAFTYHPRAHGDSAGNPAEVTFDTLVDDAMTGADYARDACGAEQIAWVGVRFGALIASEAIRRRGDTAGVALWEPVVDAGDYFQQLMRHALYYDVGRGVRPSLTVEAIKGHLERDGKIELLLFDLYRAFVESASESNLEANLSTWRGPVFIAQFDRHSRLSRRHIHLKDALESVGARVNAALFTENCGTETRGEPWRTPEALATRMGDWLDRLE